MHFNISCKFKIRIWVFLSIYKWILWFVFILIHLNGIWNVQKLLKCSLFFYLLDFYHSEISKSSNVNLKKGSNKIITRTCLFLKSWLFRHFFPFVATKSLQKRCTCIFKFEYEYTFLNGAIHLIEIANFWNIIRKKKKHWQYYISMIM